MSHTLPNQPNTAQPESDSDVLIADKSAEHHQPSPPSKYRVLLNNDDFTPMDFVVHILMHFFQHNADAATEIMLKVHFEGKAVCGIYIAEIAETKVAQVNTYARQNEHPLLCTLEKDS